MEYDFLRIFTWIIWFAALITFCIQIREYPKTHRKERILYSFAIISYILHVLVFYTVVYFKCPDPRSTETMSLFYLTWSNILRIHGGFAMLFKEIISIIRIRLFNSRGTHID